ncbi:putative clathrin assembly protein At5g57200 [Papaver somniferum]|uniref:putative clathrin assembly protein At5g57200 n=1 Tax=Papaver somniferum TaxID=3469 RepID=UPI000E6FAD6B|nr:putative clathrin assembly protein At5g57200 [Papaver somniferum]
MVSKYKRCWEHLSALQQLLYRLIGCQLEGGAYHNYLIQHAVALVLLAVPVGWLMCNGCPLNMVTQIWNVEKTYTVEEIGFVKAPPGLIIFVLKLV